MTPPAAASCSLRLIAAFALIVAAWPQLGAAASRPDADPKRIINESFGFLKDREPTMTEEEFALYERVIPMASTQPELVLTMLANLVADDAPESPAFELALGNVYYANNRVADAERHFRRAVERHPQYLRAWRNLGLLHYGEDRFEEAARCLARVVALGDREPETLGVLAYSLHRSGHALAAEMVYLQALAADPMNETWIGAVLQLLTDQGDHARAEPLARKLVTLRPDQPGNWTRHAALLADARRPAEAIAVLELASTLGVAEPAALVMLGDLLAEQGRDADAVAAYRRAEAALPGAAAGRLLAEVRRLVAARQIDEARAALAALPAPEERDARIRYLHTQAAVRHASGDTAGAYASFEEALRLAPFDGPTLLALGALAQETGDAARARVAYASATRQADVAHRAHLELANLALRARDFADSLLHLEAALELERSPTLLRHVSRIREFLTQNTTTPSAHAP